MNFNNIFPEWKNSGTEPSAELKTSGFKAGYKPPAAIFNWFWSKVCKAITEIQTNLSNVDNTSDLDKPVSTATTSAISTAVTNLKNTFVTEKGGFQGGVGATATNGAAIGNGASSGATGGAVGMKAKAGTGGFAGGYNASASTGGTIGKDSNTTTGGAAGQGAVSSAGFAGGNKAVCGTTSAPIDAIQLGTGTNTTAKSLQVYDKQLMDADGKIPWERMTNLVIAGSYTGTGYTSQGTYQNRTFVNLGYEPKYVMIRANRASNGYVWHIIKGADYASGNIASSTAVNSGVVWVDSDESYPVAASKSVAGFFLNGTSASATANESGVEYCYVIFR
jgi:hypothetical protein